MLKRGILFFYCGNKNHPENIGTISYCGINSFIIETEKDICEALNELDKSNLKKLLIISQTTFSTIMFDNIIEKLKTILNSDIKLVIKNTICNATDSRQKETDEISKNVEYMVIVGGKNSSNTKKLYDIANMNCKNTIFIEDKTELNLDEIRKYNTVGIMAGASTPRSLISDIKEEIENLSVDIMV